MAVINRTPIWFYIILTSVGNYKTARQLLERNNIFLLRKVHVLGGFAYCVENRTIYLTYSFLNNPRKLMRYIVEFVFKENIYAKEIIVECNHKSLYLEEAGFFLELEMRNKEKAKGIYLSHFQYKCYKEEAIRGENSIG